MRNVKIGNFEITENSQPFFVAELGICHEGSLDVAIELTRKSVEAGVDCIKTETFQRETIVFHPSAVTTYYIKGKKITEPLSEHMKKYQLSFDEHHQIKSECDKLGVPFMSTAHDSETIDFLVDIGASSIKIASPDIVNFPLLRYAAQSGLPVIFDTGGALQYEIEIAIKVLRENGKGDIIVNHNPVGHPAPADQHDLRIINRLQDILGVPIGLADHYEEYEMLYAAVAIGANLLEKPVSRNRFVAEPERNWSVTIDDLQGVIKTIKNTHVSLGKPERMLSKEGVAYRNRNRSACVAKTDLNKGEKLALANVIFGRPRNGIGVEHWDLIEGRKLRHQKMKFEFIQWEDLE